MFGWLAGRYLVTEALRCQTTMRTVRPDDRGIIIQRLRDAMDEFRDLSGDHGAVRLRNVFQQAVRDRKIAAASGSEQFTDREWLAPALVESWAGALLALEDGRITRQAF